MNKGYDRQALISSTSQERQQSHKIHAIKVIRILLNSVATKRSNLCCKAWETSVMRWSADRLIIVEQRKLLLRIPTRNHWWKTASAEGRDHAESCWARRNSSSTSPAGWLDDLGRRVVPTTMYSYSISASSPHHNNRPPSFLHYPACTCLALWPLASAR